MRLMSEIVKKAVEGNGEVELRIRIPRDTTLGELEEKVKLLLLIFPSEDIQVV